MSDQETTAAYAQAQVEAWEKEVTARISPSQLAGGGNGTGLALAEAVNQVKAWQVIVIQRKAAESMAAVAVERARNPLPKTLYERQQEVEMAKRQAEQLVYAACAAEGRSPTHAELALARQDALQPFLTQVNIPQESAPSLEVQQCESRTALRRMLRNAF